MSLRSHTYTYTSAPSSPTRSPAGSPFFPPLPTTTSTSALLHTPPDSPTRGIDAKHHAQLAAYKRDPARAAAANRLATLTSSWSGFRSGSDAAGKRLSLGVEEARGVDDENKLKGRNPISRFIRKYIYAPDRLLSGRRAKRCLAYSLALVVLYFVLLKPILSATSHSQLDLVGQASSGIKKAANALPTVAAPSAWQKPTRPRVRDQGQGYGRGRHAPLPPSLMSKSVPDHKIDGGLLHVNPKSHVHPIYQLIRDARDQWDAKVAKQSKTLHEAVIEYRKRYGRQPPKGFDKWWAYICDHDVPLPDEYDQIDRDILPFHALSPRDLNLRTEEATHLPDTYTLKVRHGSIRTYSTYDPAVIQGANERLQGQAELLKPIAQHLEDLTVVYSVHDTATALVGWDHRRELLEHVEEEEYFDEDGEIDVTLRGWQHACAPSSALRRARNTVVPEIPSTSMSNKTFISSHSDLMDLCSHPELVGLHGALAGKNPLVQPLTPIFSLSKTNLHADVLGVPTEQWVDSSTFPSVPWEEKTNDKLMWRGSNTGTFHSVNTPWRKSHRTRLLSLTHLSTELDGDAEGYMEVRTLEDDTMTMLPAPKAIRSKTLDQAKKQVEWVNVNAHYMDMAFTGSPIQCDIDDGTCEDLAYEYHWADPMTHEAALKYKYVVDVDGNAWSARFKRLLTSGSLILKSTIMPEWWTDRIQPWVHYVPVQLDYSDLYDTIAFFQGDLTSPQTGEQLLAKDIAESGKVWASTHWRKEDMTAYVFRLYLEWGRLVAPRRSSMDFVYDQSMERIRE